MSADVTKDLLERIANISNLYQRFGATCTFEGQPMMHLSHLEEIAELAARAEASLAEHQPKADGWIPWGSFEVKLKSGASFVGNESDIIAYRVVKP